MSSEHPYTNQPSAAFWSKSVARVEMNKLDPMVESPHFITPKHRVATAGSCFAQHIARKLMVFGYNYYIAEKIHPIFDAETSAQHNYGIFSARYGNIYTSRQLLQLMKRCLGEFDPLDKHWDVSDYFVDPVRPTVQPGGFRSIAELDADRHKHLRCVKKMFEELDVFVFTLGLTEAWLNSADGLVYPVCPGVAGGVFDEKKHIFHNFSHEEICADILEFLEKLRSLNPNAKVILTVSPVPLAATATDGHVLVATTYSKSVLRVAAEQICRTNSNVYYFPSYEIITGAFNRGSYFAKDLRNITEEGVDHVMRVFQDHFLQIPASTTQIPQSSTSAPKVEVRSIAAQYIEVECNEAALDRN